MKIKRYKTRANKKKDRHCRVIFIPEKINLNEHVRKYPPAIPAFSVDILAQFLHLVNDVPAHCKNAFIQDGFVSLNSVLLQQVHYHYKKYFDYAENTGLIVIYRAYVPGQFSRGYKFTNANISRLKAYVITNSRLCKKLARREKEQNCLPPDLEFLSAPYESGRLKFDYEAAMDLLEKRDRYFQKYPEEIPLRKNSETEKSDPLDLYNHAKNCFESWRMGCFRFKPDEYGRVHSILTNTPKKWRHFLSYDGEELVCIDIANCQPYLLTLLFNSEFFKNIEKSEKNEESDFFKEKGHILNINQIRSSRINEIRSKINHGKSKDFFPMLVDQINETGHQQLNLYKMLCSKGMLYEYLQEILIREIGPEFQNGKLVKKSIYQTIFTDNRYISHSSAHPKRVFRDAFPLIYDMLYLIKRPEKEVLAWLLQGMESTLVLHCICKRINQERPEVPLLTIHDSIATTVSFKDYLREVMIEELTERIGIAPKLHDPEYWNKEKTESFFISPPKLQS